MKTIVLATALFALTGIAFAAIAQTPQTTQLENAGPNPNIVRWHEAEILYQTMKEKRARGSERFSIMVHPDKTRTLITHNDIFARNAVMNVVMRVSDTFRPIEAFTAYWNDGGFKGSGVFRIRGNQMTAEINGPSGHFTQSTYAPDAFSLLSHPLAFDGWHGGTYDKKVGGVQRIATLNIDAISKPQNPILATPMDQTWELKGIEEVTVPAGTFTTEHYRVNDFDVWVMGADRVLVKYQWPSLDREYLLTNYLTGPK